MSKCNRDMQTRHSSDIGIADFRLSNVHGSDYPLFEYCSWNRNNSKIANAGKPGSRQEQQGVYFFLRFLPGAGFSIANSSSFFPSLIAATSHRGFAPRPAHVLPALSRYFGGTFLPFSDPPRPLLDAISPPNLASWLCSSVLLRLSSFPTSSRNCKSCSTDIEPRAVLRIGYLSRQRKHHTTFLGE